jgi:hypothetical protein
MRALATAAVAIFAAACAPKPTVMLTCDDFKKNSDGTWTTVRKTTIKVNNTSTGLESPMIGPGVINVNGVDLAAPAPLKARACAAALFRIAARSRWL